MMGYGYWTRESFVRYSAANGRRVNAAGNLDPSLQEAQLFTQRGLHPQLNPRNVMRECCDSDDHPATIPVILALDVTGSMGVASAEVARKMNEVMTRLYNEVKDVEFMVMGIGDLAYDHAPIQISQFEADVRIAEQLDKVYMEHGGGGNAYESYTAAWYMAARHTRLDCIGRGKRGLIITMGDEPLNPYLPHERLSDLTGDPLQADVDTPALYAEVARHFDVCHLHVNHTPADRYWPRVEQTFGQQLGGENLHRVTVDSIADKLVELIKAHAERSAAPAAGVKLISW